MPGSMALMSGLLDVLGACNTKTQSCFLERETAPRIKCEKNTSECWNQIDVFSDFDMTCTSGVLSFGEALNAREIKSLASTTTASTFVFWNGAGIKYWAQDLSWSIVEHNNINRQFSAYVNCTIIPAWSRRMEHSVKGTLKKEIVQVFRPNRMFPANSWPQNQSTLLASIPVSNPIAFSQSSSCFGVATPWCVLKMIQSILETMNPYYSVNRSELERQTKANLLSRLQPSLTHTHSCYKNGRLEVLPL
ncbi:hypothetical protein BCR33DRAFT_580979 [Rhizoclosmatium globosum]|uniref:Uncharacterized protein n=1 Tax=Rhizoclosmatium globosum TaxID=329046 RepID=A0A1Y2CQW5_9FUNG|nr:hypothetical protein BCR33DRAFT_580979 [Rhizoclosmatium globosum]|eukprot:ORY49363.1 hypothetical protein BCR33DRAFT_580979 [Rhizoclosmatium globosum]